jgi:protein disulfide-isomerase A6
MKIAIVLAAIIALCAAEVVVLTPQNFDQIVLDETKNVFVKFYAPWCGHCQRMVPAWEQLADSVKDQSDVVIAKLDASEHQELGGRFGVRGFPTLKFFTKGNKQGKAYQGARDLESFKSFVTSNKE